MTRTSRHPQLLAGVAVFLVALFVVALSPARAVLTAWGPTCGGLAPETTPLGAAEAPDGTGGDQESDECSIPSAVVPFVMPVAFLDPLGSKTPDLLLVRFLFRPPTPF